MEQISEELRNLDEMLAGKESTDGAVEVTADETSPAPSEAEEEGRERRERTGATPGLYHLLEFLLS